MRVMLDTNVFISMIFFPSNQTRELAKRLTDRHQMKDLNKVDFEKQIGYNRIRTYVQYTIYPNKREAEHGKIY